MAAAAGVRVQQHRPAQRPQVRLAALRLPALLPQALSACLGRRTLAAGPAAGLRVSASKVPVPPQCSCHCPCALHRILVMWLTTAGALRPQLQRAHLAACKAKPKPVPKPKDMGLTAAGVLRPAVTCPPRGPRWSARRACPGGSSRSCGTMMPRSAGPPPPRLTPARALCQIYPYV